MVKILYIIIMKSSASGGLCPQTSTGASPLDLTGGLLSPRFPKLSSTRKKISDYASGSQRSLDSAVVASYAEEFVDITIAAFRKRTNPD